MTHIIQKSIGDIEDKEIEKIIENHHKKNGNTLTLLQDIQEKYGYLPRYVLSYISKRLFIPLANIYAIATFYSQFKLYEKGKYVITCCDGTACHVKGSPLLQQYLISELKIKPGETTEDKLFSLEIVNCLGCCAIAPVCIINEDIYGSLNLKKMKRILNKLKKESKGGK
ncbi:MAG: NADH-quinone oxidoreductase subunit NuoE family protein [Promethearchaeota archaeon]